MKSSTIPSPTLTSNIFGAKCSPSPGKKSPGKNPVRRAFKKIQIQMIADILLFCAAGKRKDRCIKGRDEFVRAFFLRFTNGFLYSFDSELSALFVGPFEETIRGQDWQVALI